MSVKQILSVYITCWILTSGKAIYAEQTVEILELSLPRYPKAGEDVILRCRFRLGGYKHRLYTVNWWRGKDQFFTFKMSNFQPKNAYKFRGIDVVMENSTDDTVVLRKVSEESSGLYKCEVMGEGPAFRTAVETKRMNVIVPPERLEITHKVRKYPQNVYQIDDFVQLNCTAYKVKPRPLIVWRINGIEVKRTETKRYPDLEDHRGHVTSTLGLQFLAVRYFINRRARVSCMVEIQGHQFVEEEELTLNPSAAFDLYSSAGWSSSIGWQVVCLVFLITHSSVL